MRPRVEPPRDDAANPVILADRVARINRRASVIDHAPTHLKLAVVVGRSVEPRRVKEVGVVITISHQPYEAFEIACIARTSLNLSNQRADVDLGGPIRLRYRPVNAIEEYDQNRNCP